MQRLERLYDADYFGPFRGTDYRRLLLDRLDLRSRLSGHSPVRQSLYLYILREVTPDVFTSRVCHSTQPRPDTRVAQESIPPLK